jgi:hypothetical protein
MFTKGVGMGPAGGVGTLHTSGDKLMVTPDFKVRANMLYFFTFLFLCFLFGFPSLSFVWFSIFVFCLVFPYFFLNTA